MRQKTQSDPDVNLFTFKQLEQLVIDFKHQPEQVAKHG